jgi:two-component system sensor histidine kinase DegS
MMVQKDPTEEINAWDAFLEEVKNEQEQASRAIKEINLMLEQSQVELNKLGQRNANINAHIGQVQAQIDTLPRADIRMAYDSALDAQQRLFVMRGQIEKLQSDKTHLEKYLALIEQIQSLIEGGKPGQPARTSSASATVEMLINAQETERQRLSRQMHDGTAQALSNFILQTEIAMRLFDVDQTRAREELNSLKASAMDTFQKVRSYIFELRPMMLDDLGLVPTIRRYAETFKEQTGLEVSVIVSGVERRFEPYLEIMIFRGLQELLGNAVRLSHATQAKVQLMIEDNAIKVSVEDNGKGIDTGSLSEGDGLGLKLIRERTEMLGGFMEIDSVPGQGTNITFQVPTMKQAAG